MHLSNLWMVGVTGLLSISTAYPASATDSDISTSGACQRIWTDTVSSVQLNSGKFADFENTHLETPLGTYWSAFDDKLTSGTSEITNGTELTDHYEIGHYNIQFKNSTGSDGIGKAAMIEYKIGKRVSQDTGLYGKGFVGIRVPVYDSFSSVYWNAKGSNISSIYFEYSLQGDSKYATFELRDSNDVPDAYHLNRIDKRGENVVWHMNLPNTNGAWHKVRIPFDSLVYCSDLPGSKYIPLNSNALARMDWVIRDTAGATGRFALDNVYFPDILPYYCLCIDAVKNTSNYSQTALFRASFQNGKINVNWNNTTDVKNGVISLINVQGAIISAISLKKSAQVHAVFSTQKLSSGMYFVKINAVDLNGKSIAMQMPVSVIK